MAKNNRHFQLIEHKSIIRDRYIRTFNPIAAVRLRAILDELKREEERRG